MRIATLVVLGLLVVAPVARAAPPVRLECTADTSICIHPSEQTYNHGGKSRLRVKGNEHILLMKFDIAPLQRRATQSARLYFHPAGEVKLKTMGISTVLADWQEGRSSGPAKKGEVTYLMAAHGERHWDGPGSTLLGVSFGATVLSKAVTDITMGGLGESTSAPKSEVWYGDVRQEADGWLSIDMPAAAVDAMVRGRTFGLAVSDEKGQTRANNDIFSREQSGKAPYLMVRAGNKKLTPSPIKRGVASFAYRKTEPIKDLVAGPRPAPKAAEWTEAKGLRYHVGTLWAQFDPTTGKPYSPGGISGRVFDGRRVRLHTARNSFACVQVAVMSGGAAHAVSATELRDAGGRALGGWVKALPVWYTRDKAGRWWPDPLLPDNAPGGAGGVPNPRCRVTLVEVYVPKTARPGSYTGAIVIGPAKQIRIPLEVTVHKATLPDTLGFKVSLNTYGSPGGKHGRRYGSPEFAAEELAWHRMAHEHRSTIAVVPYSQSGQMHDGTAPKVRVSSSGDVAVDWAEWDRHWAPYFTGQAFKGLPRDGVPLDHFYLPMHENWPLEIEKHYRWAGAFDTHWQRAGPIEEGFDKRYQKAFTNVTRAFARHVAAAKWKGTQFQCYLNNKYSFKQRGRGSSYWLLDEPMHRDDYLALQFFGRLFADGVKTAGSNSRLQYRIDLSRPQWDRGYLEGVTDLCVCNRWRQWPRETFERRYNTVWSYGTTPGPDAPMTGLWQWLLEAWAAGCDGMVPWQTIGRQDSWTTAEATSVIYPSRPGAKRQGPVASLRLKALLAAQQDIELWHLLARTEGWSAASRDRRLIRVVAKTGRKFARIKGLDRGDSVTVDLGGVTADEIIDLRQRVLEALDK